MEHVVRLGNTWDESTDEEVAKVVGSEPSTYLIDLRTWHLDVEDSVVSGKGVVRRLLNLKWVKTLSLEAGLNEASRGELRSDADLYEHKRSTRSHLTG